MRKIAALLLFVACLFSATVTFCGSTVTVLPDGNSKDLSVDYTNHSAGISVPVSQGEVKGQLPDGTGFSVENLPENAVALWIYPVQKTEKEAYGWIESCIAEKLEIVVPYYVICTDGQGKDLSSSGIKITVDLPKNAGDAVVVYSLDSSGTTKSLTASLKDGEITFPSNGAPFFVLCTSDKNPSTSDFSGIISYFTLGFVAVFFVSVLYLCRKKSA